MLRAGEGLEPEPPLPTPAQLAWHDMEMYAFVHFTLNTFTGKEWGFGDESPAMFLPSDFEAMSIVGTLADAGFKGVVLTCKHHDGFCLWPTETTRHSVAASPWKDGKGDVVREFAEACRKRGVRFGVYLSPWDRNAPSYGTTEYIQLYRKQLDELSTRYGPLFLAWFDGANGGDGYYGGAAGKRMIDRSTYYGWEQTWSDFRKHQPGAVIFSDVGPDVRWVGNESGAAGYPCWATYDPVSVEQGKRPAPGTVRYQLGETGMPDGSRWMPAEVDVSIRPGWFWHEGENAQVRSPENLLELYFKSVGRGANLNLNVPPDRRGRLHEEDRRSLAGFRSLLDDLYGNNFASGAKVSASSAREECDPSRVLDRKRETYWAASRGDRQAVLRLVLPTSARFDVVRLAEPIQLGQRIRRFRVDVKEGGRMVPWIQGGSIGARVLLKGRPVTTDEVHVIVEESRGIPALCEVSLWKYPERLQPPTLRASRDGRVQLEVPEGCSARYTLDGSEPGPASSVYEQPLTLPRGGVVRAASERNGRVSASASLLVPATTEQWKGLAGETAKRAFDGDAATLWRASGRPGESSALEIDMGRPARVKAVLYTPPADSHRGTIDRYAVFMSKDGKHWGAPVAEGEFSNIRANPVRQKIEWQTAVEARYLRFVGLRTLDGESAAVAELGVLEE